GFSTSNWGAFSTGATWVDVRVADFNADGRDDILGRNAATGEWVVGLSSYDQGRRTFAMSSWGVWSPATAWHDVAVGDFNGDGFVDIVGRADSGHWWLGTSTGTAFTTALLDWWSPA